MKIPQWLSWSQEPVNLSNVPATPEYLINKQVIFHPINDNQAPEHRPFSLIFI